MAGLVGFTHCCDKRWPAFLVSGRGDDVNRAVSLNS